MHLTPILFPALTTALTIPSFLSVPISQIKLTMSPSTPTQNKTTTIYFGYGSNLWLHQMALRCPTSQYLGIARLPNYRWIINDRGYANVVEISDSNDTAVTTTTNTNSNPTTDNSTYATQVFGLVYSLEPSDESRLDKNEGVPIAYTKENLSCDFWPSNNSQPVNVTADPPAYTRDMLVYIDRNRTKEDTPKKEYVYRMNQGIRDAVKQGVPREYVDEVMRKFIPKEGVEEEKGMAEFARRQAGRFEDESGVFERID